MIGPLVGQSDRSRLLVNQAQTISPEFDTQGRDIAGEMKLEDAEEEWSEMIKHFDEKVPPETDVGRQIRAAETVRGKHMHVSRTIHQGNQHGINKNAHMTLYMSRKAQLPR